MMIFLLCSPIYILLFFILSNVHCIPTTANTIGNQHVRQYIAKKHHQKQKKQLPLLFISSPKIMHHRISTTIATKKMTTTTRMYVLNKAPWTSTSKDETTTTTTTTTNSKTTKATATTKTSSSSSSSSLVKNLPTQWQSPSSSSSSGYSIEMNDAMEIAMKTMKNEQKLINNNNEQQLLPKNVLWILMGVMLMGGIVVSMVGSESKVVSDFVSTTFSASDWSISSITTTISQTLSDPQTQLQSIVSQIESMGSMGMIYFALAYTVAEILAIPAIPLTTSAGYLFGIRNGSILVLCSASIAAAISFLIGRMLLREFVNERILQKQKQQNPKFQKLDKVIGQNGFRFMILLRLSPIFPFALSNYVYGAATSIKFWPYFWGTLIGFTPGTIAYVYTGEIGKVLTSVSDVVVDGGGVDGGGAVAPWYIYLGGMSILVVVLKLLADLASSIIEEMDE